MCFTGSLCCNFSHYNYISIWPFYIVIHFPLYWHSGKVQIISKHLKKLNTNLWSWYCDLQTGTPSIHLYSPWTSSRLTQYTKRLYTWICSFNMTDILQFILHTIRNIVSSLDIPIFLHWYQNDANSKHYASMHTILTCSDCKCIMSITNSSFTRLLICQCSLYAHLRMAQFGIKQ